MSSAIAPFDVNSQLQNLLRQVSITPKPYGHGVRSNVTIWITEQQTNPNVYGRQYNSHLVQNNDDHDYRYLHWAGDDNHARRQLTILLTLQGVGVGVFHRRTENQCFRWIGMSSNIVEEEDGRYLVTIKKDDRHELQFKPKDYLLPGRQFKKAAMIGMGYSVTGGVVHGTIIHH